MRHSRSIRFVLPVLLLGATGCGVAPAPGDAASSATDLHEPMTTSVADVEADSTIANSVPMATDVATTTTAPTAMSRWWLFPTSDPAGLRLIDARRMDAPNCGMADCVGSTAALVYDSDDPATHRSLWIVQTSLTQHPEDADPLANAPERFVGDRRVRVGEAVDGDVPQITAAWDEPNGDVVRVDAIGITWADLAAIVVGLQPTDPAAWPSAVQTSPSDCVDSRSQLAPTLIPDGWQRFVLQAQPTGACGLHPFLMMSLVLAGTTDAPGTLVTLVTSPASGAIAPLGEPVVVNGYQGSLVRDTMGDGTATVSISVIIDQIAIEVHGNADESQLLDIVASIRPLNDVDWAALVGSVQHAG